MKKLLCNHLSFDGYSIKSKYEVTIYEMKTNYERNRKTLCFSTQKNYFEK